MITQTLRNILALPNINWSITYVIQNVYSGLDWPIGLAMRVKIEPLSNSLDSRLVFGLFFDFLGQLNTKCMFKFGDGISLRVLAPPRF